MNNLVRILSDHGETLERAFQITAGAPYQMRCDNEEYARLSIEGDTATLVWPEYTSDYYGGGYLERQSVSFPADLLLMTCEQIAIWKENEEQKYKTREAERIQRQNAENAARQTARELQTLEFLVRKYGARP